MSRITSTTLFWLATSIPFAGTETRAGAADEAGTLGEVVSEVAKDIWFIYQATNGDHWFGSHSSGAYRFDGKTITRFTTKDGLPHDQVWGFQEDEKGRLFIDAGIHGVCWFDGRSFTTLKPVDSNDWKLEPGDLWFRGNERKQGPYRFDGTTLHQLRFPKHPLEESIGVDLDHPVGSPYAIYTIYRDQRGSMWFGTAVLGACRYDGKTWQWIYEDHLTNTPNGGAFGIRSILEDADSKFWICNTTHRFAVDPTGADDRGPDFVRYQREKGIDHLIPESWGDATIYFQAIVQGDDGALWMSPYGGGIWRYDGRELTNYPVLDDGRPTHVFAICGDRSGGLWLATQEAGPYRFDGKAFVKFTP